MPPIKKVVAGSRNRKRVKRMNATTYTTTRNVLVREITMPVVFCKDCKYWLPTTVEALKDGSYINQKNPCEINCIGNKGEWRTADDFCSRGEKKMIDGYDDNFSTTDRPIYVKPVGKPAIYITSKWLDEKKDQYANVFIDDKPLIRCKDCKWFDESNDNDLSCRYFYEAMSADDFCSRGEKKDE